MAGAAHAAPAPTFDQGDFESSSNRHNPLRLAGVLASAARARHRASGLRVPTAASATNTGHDLSCRRRASFRHALAVHARPSSSSRIVQVFPQFRRDFRPTTLLVALRVERPEGSALAEALAAQPSERLDRLGSGAGSVHLRPVDAYRGHRPVGEEAPHPRATARRDSRLASRSGAAAWRRRLGLFYVTATFRADRAVPRRRTRSRRARTRSSPSGRAAESSGSTVRRSPRSSARLSRTAASGSRMRPRSCSSDSLRQGHR